MDFGQVDYDIATIKRNIGIKIAYYRKQRDFSQQELADLVGIEQQHVSAAENGRLGMSLDRIIKIAEALRIKPYLLLYHDDILGSGDVEPKQLPLM